MIDLFLACLIIFFLILILSLKIEFFFVLNFLFLILNSVLMNLYDFSLNIFGISLYVQDIFFLSQTIYIFIYLCKEFVLNKKLPQSIYFYISFLLFLLIVIKAFFAFQAYGTAGALSAKMSLYFFANILFFSVAKISNARIMNILKIVLFSSIIYSLIAIFRYFEILPHLYENVALGMWGYSESYNVLRLLNRTDLMYLVIGSIFTFLTIFYNFYKKDLYFFAYCFILPVLVLLILFSYTRSIVLVFIISLISFILINNFLKIRTIIFSLILFVLLYTQFTSSTIDGIMNAYSYENLFGENSTLAFRNIVSLAYLNHMSFSSYFFGMTFGDFPIVFEHLYFTDPRGGLTGLHSAFVETIYYFGIPISLGLLYCYFKIFKNLLHIRHSQKNRITINTLIIALIVYFFFYFAWTVDILNGILVGLSINAITNNINNK